MKNVTEEQKNAMAEITKIQRETGFDPHMGTGKDFEMLVSEYMQENKTSKGRAMVACARLYPAQHEEFIKRTNE